MKRLYILLALILTALIVSASFYGAYVYLQSSTAPTQTTPPVSTSMTPITTSDSQSTPTSAPTATPMPTSVTVIDQTGAQVIIPLPVNRIVCLNGGITEIICALGGENKIIGIGGTANWPQSVNSKPAVGTGSSSINVEAIFEMNPDLIVLDTAIFSNNVTLDNLMNAGFPVYIDTPGLPDRVNSIVSNFGQILGNQSQAAKIISNTQYYTNLIRERVQNLTQNEKTTYYYEWGYTWFSASDLSIIPQILANCGGVNICGNATVTYPTLSAEYVAQANPDIIIAMAPSITNNVTVYQDARAEMLSRDALRNTGAIEDGRVYIYNYWIATGIEYPVGELYFAKWLYPHLFEDIDPGAIYVQLIQQYFDITPQGVYAYP
ncbi:MAG: ABC transporter substrate-binding protein [Nitrososphaerota archaeon]|jgi:iron complex transport system substrate-binding protein|nr:ABC transporter substrate-binding protein [Nitrososphaerota archaeon]